MDGIELDQLESKVEHLITYCERLLQENNVLREQQRILEQEHYNLREKNNQASQKITTILSRLKSIENEQ